MIARMWRGQASLARADDYSRHATETVFPSLTGLAGHRGAYLLRREVGDRTEFLALALWESRAAVEAFTGPDMGIAVVEPEARAVLVEFDEFASHYDVVSERLAA